jgi:hypothetical protein
MFSLEQTKKFSYMVYETGGKIPSGVPKNKEKK